MLFAHPNPDSTREGTELAPELGQDTCIQHCIPGNCCFQANTTQQSMEHEFHQGSTPRLLGMECMQFDCQC